MNTQQLHALSLDQIVNAILVGGHKRSVLVQGHMGTGKSSILKMLAEKLPTHVPCYFDCTTKDLQDLAIPNFKTLDGSDFVSFVPNEELGLHFNKPVIIMFDEFGKANRPVQQGVRRTLLEHMVNAVKLPEGSIVFATTNLGAEGVGDILMAHQRNALTVVTSRKPTADEWIDWGINNDIHPTVLGWVRENPQVMQSFDDVRDPDENPYIFHPQQQRAAFVTPRSLEAASDWLHEQASLDDNTLTSLLMGTIGDRGALDLMAFVKLANQLPSLESIKQDPDSATIPTSASAVCMVVYKLLSVLERDWVDACMTYIDRLDKEAQGLFVNGVRAPKYSKRDFIMTNRKFTEWAMKNNYMFTADKV